MAFDINEFYTKLDEFYGKYDNAATEQFLKDSLANAEEYMIIPSSCSKSCSLPSRSISQIHLKTGNLPKKKGCPQRHLPRSRNRDQV